MFLSVNIKTIEYFFVDTKGEFSCFWLRVIVILNLLFEPDKNNFRAKKIFNTD